MRAELLRVGDTISVVRSGHSLGAHDAAARVLEIFPDAATGLHLYRVRWIEGRETIFRPGADVRILGCRAA
jgi:hypothetical protein